MSERLVSEHSAVFRVAKTVGAIAGGTTAFVGLLVGVRAAPVFMGSSPEAVMARAYASDVAHHYVSETAQEQSIAQRIQNAFGEKAMVRCVDAPAIVAEQAGVTPDKVGGITSKPIETGTSPSIRLRPAYCDGIIDIIGRQELTSVTSVQNGAMSIFAAVHEVGHLKGAASESQASCFGIQGMRRFISSLGASAAVADQLHRTYLENMDSTIKGLNNLAAQNEYTVSPSDCYDGGPWDMTPAISNPQDFPPQPPKE